MKSNFASLQELLNEMQTIQASYEEEATRLRRRQSWLESRRREFFDVVATNSSDFETRRKLEDTERQLEEIHGQLARSEVDLKTNLMDRRQRLIVMRNEELTGLEQERKALSQRKSEVHNELLPEAMARIAALQEEEERLGQRSDEITRRIRELNQMELPTTQIA